jgi:WD40 repeat protein
MSAEVVVIGPKVSQVDQKSSMLSHVSWAPDDSKILACFRDRAPQLICPVTKSIKRELTLTVTDEQRPGSSDAHFNEIGFLCTFSPEGDRFAIGKDRLLHIFDSKTGKTVATHSVKVNPPTAKELLGSLNVDQVLSRLPPIGTTEQQLKRLEKYIHDVPQGLTTLRWDRSGISIGTPVGAYKLDFANGTRRTTLRPITCPGMVRSPVVSPDGKFVAALFVPNVEVLNDLYWNFNKALNIARRGLCIWEIESGKLAVKFQGDDLPEWQQCSIFWSADSQTIAWGYDNKVVLFDIYDRNSRVLARSQDDETRFLAWHPRKNHIAVQDSTDGILVYDTTTGVRRASYKESVWARYKDIGERVFAWNNGGDSMVVGCNQHSIDVWKVYG